MKDAVLAIEDARFYEHSGVDYKGVLRAGLANLSDAAQPGRVDHHHAGGAQLLPPSTEKTFTRKIYEMLLTMKIEAADREQILEDVHEPDLPGQRAYGFAAASEIYFGKPLKDITDRRGRDAGRPARGALGLQPDRQPRRPSGSSTSSTACSRNGFITAEQRPRPARPQVKLPRAQTGAAVHAEYWPKWRATADFRSTARPTRADSTSPDDPCGDQTVATARCARHAQLRARQVYRGPKFIDLPDRQPTRDDAHAEAPQEHPDNDDLKAAVVLERAQEGGGRCWQSGGRSRSPARA